MVTDFGFRDIIELPYLYKQGKRKWCILSRDKYKYIRRYTFFNEESAREKLKELKETKR